MKFPYALSHFGTLIRDGYFYQDRTNRIPQLEESGLQLIFIRPRRFGKSLLLSMLEHYYDLNRADQFEALFSGLAIGKNPTLLRNSFLILNLDFSIVKAQGTLKEVEIALHRHVNDRLTQFIRRYADQITAPVDMNPNDAVSSLESVRFAVHASGHSIYLLIDEYDNFANDVLMAKREQADYERLLYGEGELKRLFKAVKAGANRGIERVFITGVSPIVLSDMTSGYNVGEDIYLKPEFNDLCGFTEAEISAILQQLAAENPRRDWSEDKALELMRTFYDGYRFATKAKDRIYNPTLSLYFLKPLQTEGSYPERMLDENLAMDRSKLRYIAELRHGEELIAEALNGEEGVLIPQLARRFGVADVLDAVKDKDFMASLLYYFGILTLSGIGFLGKSILNIPNLVARSLYVERLRDVWLPTYQDKVTIPKVAEAVYVQGDLAPIVEFIEQRYFPILSNRDYAFTNELAIKLAFLTLLFNDRLYMMVSEIEVNHRYADLSMIVRPDMRKYQALDVLLEFKYVGLKALKLSGEQVRSYSMEELAALPLVQAALASATEQARQYGGVLIERYDLKDLRQYAVVSVGLERVVWRELTASNASLRA